MERTPEPELMEGLAQAQAYAEADFSQANAQFLRLFAMAFSDFTGHARVLDLGCGPGQILFDFAQKFPGCTCLGIDGSAAMLSHGRAMAKGINDSSVSLQQCCLPLPSNFGRWQVILSNSLLHHLAEPAVLWQTISRVAAPGALVLVMDLCRPDSERAAAAIVKKYSATEPQILQDDFCCSLLAAYRVDEVTAQLHAHNLDFQCREVSDRHLAVWGRM
ncbi:MAG: class I SAM-dependent methyltransferase [Proteobacteria bacterium]|nr:class I SAM-dependent methyltransferase [Pseudomonadota bacterium]MBU1639804.1 class I SAM-dependent methyltransferase [Pseudomonadota bacterium]